MGGGGGRGEEGVSKKVLLSTKTSDFINKR